MPQSTSMGDQGCSEKKRRGAYVKASTAQGPYHLYKMTHQDNSTSIIISPEIHKVGFLYFVCRFLMTKQCLS